MDTVRLKRTAPVARKRYMCDFCNQNIEKGEQYVKYTGVNPGEFFAAKRFYIDRRHLRCDSAYLIDRKCEECKGGLTLPEGEGYFRCMCFC